MIEVILALCLIWNTMYLLSSRDTYVSSEWDYEVKVIHSKPSDWGLHQVLIVPKNRGLHRKVNADG